MLSNGLNFVRNSYKILSPTSLSLNLIRGKKKKAGGSTRNQNTNKTRGKNRRLYVEDGEWVERDYMLVKQLGLNYYPGENVIYNRWTHSIYAAIPGHVIISTETLDPNSTSPVRNYVDNMNRLLNEQKEMERSLMSDLNEEEMTDKNEMEEKKIKRNFIHVIPPSITTQQLIAWKNSERCHGEKLKIESVNSDDRRTFFTLIN